MFPNPLSYMNAILTVHERRIRMIFWLYLKFIGIMFLFFTTFLFVIPFAMMIKSSIDDTLNDTYDSWKYNQYLVCLDKLFDSIDAYDTGGRFGAIVICILLFSVFWVIGIPIVVYIINSMNKKIKTENKKGT